MRGVRYAAGLTACRQRAVRRQTCRRPRTSAHHIPQTWIGYAWSAPSPYSWCSTMPRSRRYDIDNPNLRDARPPPQAHVSCDEITHTPTFGLTPQSIIWQTAANAVRELETDEDRPSHPLCIYAHLNRAMKLQHPKRDLRSRLVHSTWLTKSPHIETVPRAIAAAVDSFRLQRATHSEPCLRRNQRTTPCSRVYVLPTSESDSKRHARTGLGYDQV